MEWVKRIEQEENGNLLDKDIRKKTEGDLGEEWKRRPTYVQEWILKYATSCGMDTGC
jgi:hypothetical protein